MNSNTSWGKVADWYHSLLEENKDSYQRALILPNLLRLLQIKKGDLILDIACGNGFFTREFYKAGAKVTGVDVSKELIALAKKNSIEIDYVVSAAEKLPFKDKSFNKAVSILAIQNIEMANEALKEAGRILKSDGSLFLVLNHPAFRIPKASSWEWNEKEKTQYRKIDSYLSEAKHKIQMHPGDKPSEYTITFHRPLQFYFKALQKAGFAVTRLEEWESHKKSEPGSRAKEENRIRKEIPMFLMLEARKMLY